jgi:hypothetical protein
MLNTLISVTGICVSPILLMFRDERLGTPQRRAAGATRRNSGMEVSAGYVIAQCSDPVDLDFHYIAISHE